MDFIQTFFVDPILNRGGYNPINTIVYLIILLAIAFFVIYPILNKRKVRFDSVFGFALLGFILWGSSMRILEDIGFFPRSANPLEAGFYLITPGIWILVGLTTLAALLLARWLGNRANQNENSIFALIGLLLAAPFVIWNLFNFQNGEGVAWIIGLWVFLFAIVWAFTHFTKNDWFAKDRLSQLAYAGQSLDGIATFVAIKGFGFSEQHVISAGVLSIHPVLFPLIKIVLVLLIIKILHDEKMDENLKGFLKILLLVIGLAPGLRDTFLLGVAGAGPMQSLIG